MNVAVAATRPQPGGGGGIDVVHERMCGLDVHTRTVVACVLVPGEAGTVTPEAETFSAMLGRWSGWPGGWSSASTRSPGSDGGLPRSSSARSAPTSPPSPPSVTSLYFMLLHDIPFADLGGDYFDQRDRDRREQRALATLRSLGYDVAISPRPATDPSTEAA
jgi:hypothetical protein